MISKSFAVMGVLTLLSAVAHAGSAPKELYGKSITVAWTETRAQKFDSDQQEHNIGVYVQMHIYISTVGRPFVRVIYNGMSGRSMHELGGVHVTSTGVTEAAPGEVAAKDHVDFEGRSIAVYRQFRSGARRVGINLDGTACKAAVVNGREGGKSIAQYSTAFGRSQLLSVQVGSVSCSIRGGNVFGQ
jgi:hypothetical protein